MSLMSDHETDRRPALVICAYDADDQIWDPVEDLSGQLWNPPGARTVSVEAQAPQALADALSAHLATPECRGVLLIGRTRHPSGFQIQMRARNRVLNGEEKLSATGPSTARATAPVAEMVRALREAGIGAEATSEDEGDVGDFLLYSLLSRLRDDRDAPAVGLLRAPRHVVADRLSQGVKIVAGVIARQLSPLPRAQFG